MKDLILNMIIIHIVLAFLGRGITLYMPELFSNNAIIELLNMNQRKLVTTTVVMILTSGLAQYLLRNNIKIKV